MKFVIARQELNDLISKATNVVGAKATIPILSNLLIEAQSDELVITATDLTVGIRCFAKAKVLEKGATTVPAKRFAQLIRELTCHNIEVTDNGNDVVEIMADSSRFKMHGMNKSEYPSLPDFTGAVNFTIGQGTLKSLLSRTSFAASREDNRYVLMGVCMRATDGRVVFTGTDGRRLARTWTDVGLDNTFKGEYVLPIKAVDEICKSLDDSDEQKVTMYLMDDKVAVEGDRVMIITKLISGEYPDIDRVIPQANEHIVTLHREELITLLRQISLFTADTSHSVRFTFGEGELKLLANTIDVGEGKVSMPVNYSGQPLDIAFNPGFFLDILRHSKEETVNIGLTDSYNPGIISDATLEPSTAMPPNPLYVLMPMRLNEE